ncbi:MAG: helix-turn-helix transcriptional regulator [Acidobacteria bacterium]|nr:helix-turn-helix transcriptional regulator [Acidobacteriota bacterium]
MKLNAFASFVEFHILHHAAEDSVYGLWLIEELGEHGYKISPGTLYPVLHSMESSGLLKSRSTLFKGKIRKYYSITPTGKRYLQKAKRQIGELVREVFSEEDYRQFLKIESRKGKVPK